MFYFIMFEGIMKDIVDKKVLEGLFRCFIMNYSIKLLGKISYCCNSSIFEIKVIKFFVVEFKGILCLCYKLVIKFYG